MIRSTLLLVALSMMPTTVYAQLPANYQLKQDWLIEAEHFPAAVEETDQSVTFGNGLFTRSVDKRLGCTTKFVNHMTGEIIIRAVDPEGQLTIDGVTYSIGGAEGQPNKAFIVPEWIDQLQSPANALVLQNIEIGEPKKRLKWKRSRHHAPSATWPPKGKTIRLDYTFPESAQNLQDTRLTDSKIGRQLIFSEPFEQLDNRVWKIHATQATPRANFNNEGKTGEIYTFPNTAVYAERKVPENVKLIETTLNAGTDTSSSYGPGLGLVFASGKVIKFHIRPRSSEKNHTPALGVFDGKNEIRDVSGSDAIDPSRDITLRARIEDEIIHFDAKRPGKPWKHYTSIENSDNFERLMSVRIGKMSQTGGKEDAKGEQRHVRLKIHSVNFYGQFDPSQAPASSKTYLDTKISVHYEIYDGLPALSKWITVTNSGVQPIHIDSFIVESLSVVEKANPLKSRSGAPHDEPTVLHVETDMAFGGFTHINANRHTVHWKTDKTHFSQSNWLRKHICKLEVSPNFGPAQTLDPERTFKTFRMFQLIHDTEERERRGLALRRMYRTVAPWVTANPLMLHCRSTDEKVIKNAIDQAAEVGFEMVIISFGSGFNAENSDPAYLKQWKTMNDYAKSKGIHLGCYSLYSSRSAGKENDIVPPAGMAVTHKRCPAITSDWGQNYINKLYKLFDTTNFMVFEHDGPYPGDVDVTPRPPLQKGISDSRWVHWKIWTKFYQHLRARGVYTNTPDYYYLAGSNKCGMGYREANWSLPRAQQLLHTRQTIFDGTWEKTPSMGWMFVPLTEYHGGGEAATIEPLDKHLDHYEMMMKSNLGLGVQACYRGLRLYDTERTKQMVTNTVAWFKKHRTILESDLIHGRRADGSDLDWMLHVNSNSEEKAFLSAYNPTDKELSKEIFVPLYYAGLRQNAQLSINGEYYTAVKLDAQQRCKVTITIPPHSYLYAIWKK